MSLSGPAKVLGILALGLFFFTGLAATEPYVMARILPEWDETGETLRLSIIPDQALVNATLRLEIPGSLALEPGAGPFQDRFVERVAQEGHRALEAGLGELTARSILRLSFRPSAHRLRGGVVAFILEGETVQGKQVREAIGVAVGHPGERPVRRHGALEFPAVPLSAEPQ